ncbi:alpha/beta hydrolase [Amycolatopsis carbonis]|uniref:Alpha/beta hydrolase n=1 Tax=Amycolatopsis carbonis TaxID=715471 RepID=A0A9Y2MVA7_9PSEU|nr:alpha/beta hydrolase [Amycolatopsis sp. 2-15]WIX82690.1 alpha/beta hydrolase [Amycolatopsis sp. 2-15]
MALALPGFGAALPAGFTPAKDAYAAWLAEELAKITEPIDLVGHDWGALPTLRVATLGEVPPRSWVADVGSVFHPDYAWHPWATTLISPGDGEDSLRHRREADPGESLMLGNGVPAAAAAEMAAALDEDMSRGILGLYRSAVPNVAASWAPSRTSAPGLILVPTADRVDDEMRSRDVAARLGARVELLDGMGHWWMYDRTGRVVSVLQQFWGAVTGS